ncbi:sulfurtransferase [Cellulomonas shaoxiangyii]|uniref:Sulfurtransferase n=1 Tax=Cellulomonas shaoxiangyii TaxID=2566013 RepID=A0A4P7SJR7_9CELL|nr:rhodanese-like domain-containing protein [Cellulomonas shaoxiangyii]QCB92954.1 sulfurtransferase [Cellulomonas shaoxiangyii]TGY79884.1 sulfurtransferase [Cellulomonas shaoxiangyii]
MTEAPTPAPGRVPADRAELRRGVLVDADELAALLAGDAPPALLDVRWALGRTDGREQHHAGHVPGAVYVDLDTELAAPASAAAGRHPLPALADLERAARRWGLRQGQAVVVYDAGGGTSAARAWWLLRWAGVRDVRLLDGGLAAWAGAGHALEAGEVVPQRGDVVLVADRLPTVDADGAAALAADGVLLDARAVERYAGESEPVDPRAGHVPGAVSAPTTGNLGADGRFLPADALAARFAALGVPPADAGRRVGVYCGSGVTAAHEVAALATLGVDAALYPGSWSQWSHDADRPVAVGR